MCVCVCVFEQSNNVETEVNEFMFKQCRFNVVWPLGCLDPEGILHKSIAGRYRPVRVADGPITARCSFM